MKLASIISVLALATTTHAAYRGSKNVSDRRQLQSKSGSSKSGSSKSGGGGSGDTCDDDRTLPDTPANQECDICELNNSKPRTFYFKYNAGQGATSDYQTTGEGCKASCSADTVYPATASIDIKDKNGVVIDTISVSDGSEFSFSTSSSETQMDFGDADLDCYFHTSCSQPMVPGDAFGPFELLPDVHCAPTPAPDPCLPQETECVICDSDNKVRPSSLTLQYNPDGKNSAYDQNEKESVCKAGSYPASTTIDVVGEEYTVTDGTVFTIVPDGDRFDADTMFDIEGFGSCSIHTSCSKMLVQGDQIGPFIVLSGNECKEPEPAVCDCIITDKTEYNCGEPITISWDFSYSDGGAMPLADDWIGIYPCGTEPKCLPEPIVWQYTCGDDPGCIGSVSVADLQTGSYTFDSLPLTNTGYNYHKFPLTQWYEEQGGALLNCFQAYLVRYEAPSPPPYCQVCMSAEFTIGGSIEYECTPSVGTPGAALGGNNVPGVCQVLEGEPVPDVCNDPEYT